RRDWGPGDGMVVRVTRAPPHLAQSAIGFVSTRDLRGGEWAEKKGGAAPKTTGSWVPQVVFSPCVRAAVCRTRMDDNPRPPARGRGGRAADPNIPAARPEYRWVRFVARPRVVRREERVRRQNCAEQQARRYVGGVPLSSCWRARMALRMVCVAELT